MGRLARHGRVSTALALLSDDRLAALVADAAAHGTGIGGQTATLSVAGVQVFVKQVPLTDLEREHPRDTANLFRLPMYCQYGVGSTGFGVWRELAAHLLTTDWVLTGRHAGFPLLHHWRVLPGGLDGPGVDIEERVAYWGGSPAVRHRLSAIERAAARVVLFLEHVPHTVHGWLRQRLAEDPDAACALVERQLLDGLTFLNRNGLWHFDGHFGNLLTDGRRVYFADFGLALHERFELTADEAAFLRRHASYDLRYSTGHLATWLAEELRGDAERAGVLRAAAAGSPPPRASPVAAGILRRYAATALVMNEFFDALVTGAKTAPYPYAGGF